MTRPIKFRAQKQATGEWVYFTLGDLICGKIMEPSFIAIVWINWCEFTGLLDKNGKEIYEGDVLETDGGEKLEVKWNRMFARFRFGNQATHDYDIATRMKIIGNVWGNPELLK